MRDNPELTADWDIIWDDRGHFAEPHTGHEIGLGTLPVREYIEGFREPVIEPVSVADAHVSTFGPAGRYHAVLFVEKEGFEPIFQAAGVYERYDLAPMSTKGMSDHGGAHAGRGTVRQARPAAVRPARLRQGWLQHPPDADQRHRPLRVRAPARKRGRAWPAPRRRGAAWPPVRTGRHQGEREGCGANEPARQRRDRRRDRLPDRRPAGARQPAPSGSNSTP